MKKLLSILVFSSLACASVKAQLTVNVLDTLQAAYDDIKVAASGSSLACLRNNSEFDVRTFSGNNLGPIQSTTSLTGFYRHLEIVGNYAYAVGYDIKAIDISNPVAPVVYPESLFVNDLRATDHWGNLLISLSNIDGFNYKLQVFTLFYPMSPQKVDTLVLPADGDIKVSGNKLYYFWSDAAKGDRVRIYTLSNTLPYLSLTDSIVLNNSTSVSLPSLDIAGSQLIAKTSDSIYRFRIGASGDLNLLARMHHTLHVFNMVAIDTNTLCYGDPSNINVHQLHSDKRTPIASLSGFASFQSMDKLGKNVFYSGSTSTFLVHIHNDVTAVENVSTTDGLITVNPNPSSDQWNITSTKSGRLQVYSIDGKMIQEADIEAGKSSIVDARALSSGIYFYSISFTDQRTVSGKLLKN